MENNIDSRAAARLKVEAEYERRRAEKESRERTVYHRPGENYYRLSGGFDTKQRLVMIAMILGGIALLIFAVMGTRNDIDLEKRCTSHVIGVNTGKYEYHSSKGGSSYDYFYSYEYNGGEYLAECRYKSGEDVDGQVDLMVDPDDPGAYIAPQHRTDHNKYFAMGAFCLFIPIMCLTVNKKLENRFD